MSQKFITQRLNTKRSQLFLIHVLIKSIEWSLAVVVQPKDVIRISAMGNRKENWMKMFWKSS